MVQVDIPKGPWGISAIKFFSWSQYQISAHFAPSEIIDKCSSNKKDITNHPYAYQNISEDLSAAASHWLIYYNAES